MRLRAHGLEKTYHVSGGAVRALRGVDLEVGEGETLAIVGESGCGKSTLARLLVGLEKPDRGVIETSESIIPMVFQDSLGSLHPRRRVEQILVEPILIREGRWRFSDADRNQAETIAAQVGITAELLGRFPHELSGGQRQRVNIGRALALDSKILVLDEPVSALDVSIQAQILNLLKELQATQGLSLIFISHDLSVVRFVAQRVAVLYLGRVVESGPAREVLTEARHPYTETLLQSDPDATDGPPVRVVQGEPPSPLEVLPGCSFAGRCPFVQPICRTQYPAVTTRGDRQFSCHVRG